MPLPTIKLWDEDFDFYGNPESGFRGSLTAKSDLCPCPFCDSDDLLVENTHTPSYWVTCQGCRARAEGQWAPRFDATIPDEVTFKRLHRAAFKAAVRAWNRRQKGISRMFKCSQCQWSFETVEDVLLHKMEFH